MVVPGSIHHSPAASLAAALEGRRSGRGWKARCPAHDDRNPSLSIDDRDGKVLVRCHAGCEQRGVIDALRARGLWPTNGDARGRYIDKRQMAVERERHDAGRRECAIRIWNEARDPRGTIAERYLRQGRKLDLPDHLCGEVLRFHPSCPWQGSAFPCLVAAFRRIGDQEIAALHRVRLDQPGRWPKAGRMMLAPTKGCAVMLDRPSDGVLAIAEGIETGLAARQILGLPVWALGSAGPIASFDLLDGVEHLIIIGENDEANRKAAAACREKWKSRHVTIIEPRRTKDMNDTIIRNNDNDESHDSVQFG